MPPIKPTYPFYPNPQENMRLKQDSIIALKHELFEFLEIRSSQAPSACADVRIVDGTPGRIRIFTTPPGLFALGVSRYPLPGARGYLE